MALTEQAPLDCVQPAAALRETALLSTALDPVTKTEMDFIRNRDAAGAAATVRSQQAARAKATAGCSSPRRGSSRASFGAWKMSI